MRLGAYFSYKLPSHHPLRRNPVGKLHSSSASLGFLPSCPPAGVTPMLRLWGLASLGQGALPTTPLARVSLASPGMAR